MDDDKCWICLTDESSTWRKVCKCNLRAHEQCILQWAQAAEEAPCCPQCREMIRIEQESSVLVELRNAVNSVITSLFGGAIVFAASSTIATNAIMNTLYEVGSISIRTMCSASMASVALGPLWSQFGRFAPFGIPLVPYSPWTYGQISPLGAVQQLYRQCAIPLVPLWLCSSGKVAAIASCLLGVLVGTVPGLPTSNRQVLLGLMAGRYAYQLFWELTAGSFLDMLAHRIYVANRRDDYTNAMDRLDELIDNARQNRIPRDPDEALEQMVEVVEVIGDLEEIGSHHDGNWLTGPTTRVLRVLQGLFAPPLSALMGKLLSNSPRLASWSTLNRNLLGMCLIVVLKDILDLVVAYKRSKMEIHKHVLNYNEDSKPKNTVAEYIYSLNQRIVNLINFDIRIGVN